MTTLARIGTHLLRPFAFGLGIGLGLAVALGAVQDRAEFSEVRAQRFVVLGEDGKMTAALGVPPGGEHAGLYLKNGDKPGAILTNHEGAPTLTMFGPDDQVVALGFEDGIPVVVVKDSEGHVLGTLPAARPEP